MKAVGAGRRRKDDVKILEQCPGTCMKAVGASKAKNADGVSICKGKKDICVICC